MLFFFLISPERSLLSLSFNMFSTVAEIPIFKICDTSVFTLGVKEN